MAFTQQDRIEFLACVMFNNLGALHWELMDYGQSRTMFHNLIHFVSLSGAIATTTMARPPPLPSSSSFTSWELNTAAGNVIELETDDEENDQEEEEEEADLMTQLQKEQFMVNAMIHANLSPSAAAA